MMDKALNFLSQSHERGDFLSSARASLQAENQQINPAPHQENRQYDMLLKRLDSKPSADEILASYCS